MGVMGTKEHYYKALESLRPRGVIWKVKDGSVTQREMNIEAEMFAKVHALAERIPEEANIATAKDCLEEWEGVFELEPEGSYEDRLAALVEAANEVGDQSPSYYKALAAKKGVTVDISEHCPFMFGDSQCGGDHEIGPEEIVYFWEMLIVSGDDAVIGKVKVLVLKRKQSHTVLTFLDKRSENGNNKTD